MYETIEKYLREVFLVRLVKKMSPLEEERSLHDVFNGQPSRHGWRLCWW